MKKSRGAGFSLIELLVGMAIGLLATIVIMQVLAASEGQKRTTTGGADAQTNGNIAAYMVQREASLAGYGLPVYSINNPALNCEPLPVHPIGGVGMFPVAITEGGAASDTLTIRYGSTAKGGVPVTLLPSALVAPPIMTVVNNLGCDVGDDVLIVNGSACAMQRVTALPATVLPVLPRITLAGVPAVTQGNIACLGTMNEIAFTTVANGGLTRNGVPIVANVVNFQAQYGLTADLPSLQNISTIAVWQNAAAIAPNLRMRQRIRAVRVALITRSANYEKDVVSFACTPATPKPNQSCVWRNDVTPVNVDLSGLGADWDHYRYNVFEVIIPLRTMVWSSNTLPLIAPP